MTQSEFEKLPPYARDAVEQMNALTERIAAENEQARKERETVFAPMWERLRMAAMSDTFGRDLNTAMTRKAG